MKIRIPAVVAAIAAAFPCASIAQSSTPQMSEVVVTATRTARTTDETLAAVTVITREDIERQQARSVSDLFRGLPGITVGNSGGRGKATSVFMRGTESDHVLVLIDGVKVGSATAGAAAFQDMPVDLIERVEIVRGPRSSLYGSEAIGGVIQIFTRRGGGAAQPYFSVGAGSDRSFRSAVGVSGGSEHAWYSANLSRESTDGFNSCRVEAAGVGGCFTAEPDRDGYDNLSGSVRAGYRFDSGAEFDFNWLRTHADSQFDGNFQNYSESVQQTLGVRFSMSPMDHWRLTLAAGQSRDDADNFKDAAFASRFDTDRRTLSVQNDFGIGASGMLSIGVDHQDDRVSSTTAYPVTQRDNRGVFAFYQGKAGAHDYEIGLRSDDNEQFGTHNTGNLAWGYALSDGLRATAAYGTAFKAPSFNELYFPFYGNPALEPETARSLEFGLAGVATWGRWSANVFRTTVDDLIAYDSSIFAANNVEKARIDGFEATLATRLMSWDLSGSLTLLDPENRSSGLNQGNVLPRRAEQTLRLDADRDLGAWRVGTTVVAEGRRYDDLANRNRLAGYVTVDLRAGYALARDWRVQGTLVNLFDADYETARFYEQPGRGVFVTLTYQPQR
mgnify:FL=1